MKYTDKALRFSQHIEFLPSSAALLGEFKHMMWLLEHFWTRYKSSCPPPIANEEEFRHLIILLVSQLQSCKELYNKAGVDLNNWEPIQTLTSANEVFRQGKD